MNFKKYIYYLFLVVALLRSLSTDAQTKEVIVKGYVRDSTGTGIPFAVIQNENTRSGTAADLNGKYLLRTVIPATLEASLIGYKSKKRTIDNTSGVDTVEINFTLQEESAQLKGVEINATHKPELLQEAGNLLDFEVRSNKICILYSLHNHSQIRVYDSTGNVKLSQLNLNFTADSLNIMPQGLLFASSPDSTYLYRLTFNTLHSFKIPFKKFGILTKTLVDYNNPYYYHVYKYNFNTGVSYWYYSKSSHENKVFYRYENNEMADIHLQNMQDIANTLVEYNGSGEAGDTKGDANARRYGLEASLHALPMMMMTIHTVLKIVNDSVYVFNFTTDSIDVYDYRNYHIRQMPLLFDENVGLFEKKDMVVDEEKKTCYFKIEAHGVTYLKKIDLATGKGLGKQSLKYPYIQKVRLMDNYAYFSYFTNTGGIAYPGELAIYRQKLE